MACPLLKDVALGVSLQMLGLN